MKNLMDLYTLMKNGANVNEEISKFNEVNFDEDLYPIEWGYLSNHSFGYDQDLYSFLTEVLNVKTIDSTLVNDGTYAYASIKGMSKDKNYLYVYDGEDAFYVEMEVLPNRHGDGLGDEWWVDFNKMYLIPKGLLDKCDNCNEILAKDLLLNITPTESDGFDGMLCEVCYKIERGETND